MTQSTRVKIVGCKYKTLRRLKKILLLGSGNVKGVENVEWFINTFIFLSQLFHTSWVIYTQHNISGTFFPFCWIVSKPESVLLIKTLFHFPTQFLFETLFTVIKYLVTYLMREKTYFGHCVKCPLFLTDFHPNWNVSYKFSKNA
jgi:hypothetical protein